MLNPIMNWKNLCIILLCYSLPAPAQPAGSEDINAAYLSPDLDVKEWVDRFEVESREVYKYRNDIVDAIGLKPGQHVADVGAGTGLFVPLLAEKVGVQGKVYAVDISPMFIEYIANRTRERGLTQVETVLNGERSVNLPENSVDVIFTCDVYHHFTHFQDMLSTIRAALRQEGQFVVVDYDKVPGKSSEFVLQHIRDTKETFTDEIVAAGFEFVEEVQIPGFQETFMRRFVKRPALQ